MTLQAIRVVENTKETHDHWEEGVTFSYTDLTERSIPAIGIPAINNGLIIIDVDAGGKTHKYDGRMAWKKFAEDSGIPPTYTVETPSGGYHFYFRLPDTLNKDTFQPKAELFHGVDVRYRGYVVAPPTKGYKAIYGDHDSIEIAPVSLLRQVLTRPINVDELIGDKNPVHELLNVGTPLSQQQIDRLKKQLEWVQLNTALSYDEWFRGLVSLKAGVPDQELLEELAIMWTRNQAYNEGDE